MTRQVVVELLWTDDTGTDRAEVFGPWDTGESGEEHLVPVHDFLRAWHELVPPADRNRATISLVQDPRQWLEAARASEEARG